MMLQVRSSPWPEILEFYRKHVEDEHVAFAAPMLNLVRRIVAAPYVSALHAQTSHFHLWIAQTAVFERARETLVIELRKTDLRFTFVEEPYVQTRWTRTCAFDEGFSTLEHFVLRLKKWWVEVPSPGKES